jgi:hypothetical protein
VIIDEMSEVIGGQTIGLQNDKIVQITVFKDHIAMKLVMYNRLAV